MILGESALDSRVVRKPFLRFLIFRKLKKLSKNNSISYSSHEPNFDLIRNLIIHVEQENKQNKLSKIPRRQEQTGDCQDTTNSWAGLRVCLLLL